ncbi:hypothetical protein IEQ34_022858 [Dendrobium chrysotoxum]|uniref:EF-hand domain-containing protein n=1 Tax=Dendrobium chrysotoxum TaxID=161865 RepID=A0AAV7G067_DENCH|nr:hypothetical protein IEQ34_022858 [Dendrobium chrysotoxum]
MERSRSATKEVRSDGSLPLSRLALSLSLFPSLGSREAATGKDRFAGCSPGIGGNVGAKLGLVEEIRAKRLKEIMLAAAELAALRLRDLPMPSHRRFDISQKDRVFSLLDKNGDGRISIDELTEVMEDLGAGGNDAQDLMKLLDTNSDGSLSSDEFDLFQKQIELMRSLEERDYHYKAMLGNKLEMTDSTGLIQVYRKELGDKLTLNSYFQHDDQRMPLP